MKSKNEFSYEELLYYNEMKKREKKNLLWNNYEYLISDKKIQYNSDEINIIKNLLYNPMPENYRNKFWVIISGARLSMFNNKNYYKNLLLTIPENFLYEQSITLDLNRTYPEFEYFHDPSNLQKLKNILMAFSLRNSTIGYCQGFNFIVGKLLIIIDNEEEVFWVFTNIIENYLPSDFYINFFGVKNDIEIVKKIIMLTLPYVKGENFEFLLKNLITKCFISLFSQNIRGEILDIIWDSFFVYGNIILYKTFIYIVYSLFKDEMKKKSLETLYNKITESIADLNDPYSLNYFLFIYNRINQNYIDIHRNKITQKQLKFESLIKNNIQHDIKCDKNLPYCRCYIENQNSEDFRYYIIYRINKKPKIIENYFFNVNKNDNLKQNILKKEEISLDDLLIERHKHICN